MSNLAHAILKIGAATKAAPTMVFSSEVTLAILPDSVELAVGTSYTRFDRAEAIRIAYNILAEYGELTGSQLSDLSTSFLST